MVNREDLGALLELAEAWMSGYAKAILIMGIVAAALFVYLMYALLRPEKF